MLHLTVMTCHDKLVFTDRNLGENELGEMDGPVESQVEGEKVEEEEDIEEFSSTSHFPKITYTV